VGRPVAHFEILSADPQRAQAFYGELFDWKTSADESWGDYLLVDTGAGEGAIGGGIGRPSSPGEPPVKLYVAVDDLDATLRRAEELGGTTLVPPMDLPEGFGRMAVFADPDGTPVGIMA
jgi:predicted enzyme related to lactoylglutathione lyase